MRHVRRFDVEEIAKGVRFALSGDGEQVAVAAEGRVDLHATRSGERVGRIDAEGVVAVACSRTGRFVAVAVADPTIELHDANSGEVRRLSRETVPDFLRASLPRQLAFDAAGERLFAADERGDVTEWNVARARWEHLYRMPQQDVTVLPAPRGEHVAVVGRANADAHRGHVTLYRVRDGLAVVWNRGHVPPDPVTRAAFSPDGERLATCGPGDGVRVWNVEAGREVRHLPAVEERPCHGLAFVQGGRLLVVRGGLPEFVDLDDGSATSFETPDGPTPIDDLAAASDGSIVVTANGTGRFDVWSAANDDGEREERR